MKRCGILIVLLLLTGCASTMPTVVALPPVGELPGNAQVLPDLGLTVTLPDQWTLADHSPDAYEWRGPATDDSSSIITLVSQENYPYSPDEAVLVAVRLAGVDVPAPATAFMVADTLGRKSSGKVGRTRVVALAWAAPGRTYLLLARWDDSAAAAQVSALIASLRPLTAVSPAAGR
ncbi:MAG TPA: hypothetical protein PKW95_12455 [bacterium]|nr:hypothetical protein [bacterium]